MILGDNSAGHCFVLRGIISENFFKYIYLNCETENARHRQNVC